jgi:hypothetical protein
MNGTGGGQGRQARSRHELDLFSREEHQRIGEAFLAYETDYFHYLSLVD